jgi:hypothetical protein
MRNQVAKEQHMFAVERKDQVKKVPAASSKQLLPIQRKYHM